MRRITAICVVLTALLLAGCGSADRARLDVKVDAAHSAFPASWRVVVEESHADGGTTAGKTRAVSAAPGTGSPVFRLRGAGRYRLGIVVEPRDHSTGVGCAKPVEVPRDRRYSATIRLHGRTCRVVVARLG